MRSTYRILIYFILCFFFHNCSKNSDDIQVDNINIRITLSDNLRILKVDYFNAYSSDSIKFNYKDSIVEKIFSNNNRKIVYYLNEGSSLADSCVDSIFSSTFLSDVTICRFKYDNNGYIKSTERIYRHFFPDNKSIVETVNLINDIVDGNVSSVSYSGYYSDRYEYYEYENKLDIINFLGDFNGKRNTNLIKSYQDGCLSHSPRIHIDYEYVLDSEGFVKEQVKTYSYCYADGEIRKQKIIINFEYVY
jgi:hypothetical protein